MAKNSITGLPRNTAAAIAVMFSFTLVVPVILFVLEKDNFVRFYALQSLLTFIIFFILLSVSFVLSGLVLAAGFAVWLFMIYKAWLGEKWAFPYIGRFTNKILKET